jgi:hypothetical protein
MKQIVLTAIISFSALVGLAQKQEGNKEMKYFIDVHNLGPGKVTAAAVAEAHKKDLAQEDKFGVKFINYWVDEEQGKIYCLSSAKDPESVNNTHKAAHGMAYDAISEVIPGKEDPAIAGKQFYLDIHELGAGKVTAEAVAEAHKKDLAIQASNGVNFINYWVDEKNGLVYCLSQGPSAEALTANHKAAHGLIPTKIYKVTQGQ